MSNKLTITKKSDHSFTLLLCSSEHSIAIDFTAWDKFIIRNLILTLQDMCKGLQVEILMPVEKTEKISLEEWMKDE